MGTVYTLNNGVKGVEEGRLDVQHAIFTRLTGTLLPDNIRHHLASVGPSPAVVDIATGTGAWLRSLAAELPATARLDGFDFDTSKFPASVPANVTLARANMFDPFPEALIGAYDLVHVRLVKFGVKADQWVPLARNLLTLLKPGGWLLWDEMSYSSWVAIPMTQSFYDWLNPEVKYALSVGRDPYIGASLPRYVKKAGFVNCSQQVFSPFAIEDPVYRKQGSLAVVAVASQSLHGIVDRGGFEKVQTHEYATRLVDAMTAEVEEGVCEVGFEMYWTIAQKPVA